MPKKILLIRPENTYNYNNYPPLNLLCIGTGLKAAGFEVKIINCAFEKDPLRAIGGHLKDTLFAGITMLTPEVPSAYRVMKFIKENSSIPIVAGGWHSTLFAEQTAESEIVDFVVCGEGEEHILYIAKMLEAKTNIRGKIFSKKFIDLNKLDLVDYSIDENIERFIRSYLTDHLSKYVTQPMRWLPYESSRGCPSQCSFCINTVTENNHYRSISSEKVILELEYLSRKYKLTHLKFIDDNFFVDMSRSRRIAEGLLKKGIKLTWDAECRCDYFNERMLNDETLKLMKESGLIQLTLGVESGSAHSLRLMKKGIAPDEAEYAIKKCNEHGIIARSSFILEIPGENFNDIKQTITFINRMRRFPYFTCGVGTFRPYPRCELTNELLSKGYLKQPQTLIQWSDKDTIDMYTSAEYIRPWQVNGAYSESAAFFLNMQSCARLGNHQINNKIDKLLNTLFIFIGKLRNRFMFYKFPLDKKLYKLFLTQFYRKKQSMEKCGMYPLAKIK
jgi:radical SAM superfamily enzyme YgiQ (UPF0313 family)